MGHLRGAARGGAWCRLGYIKHDAELVSLATYYLLLTNLVLDAELAQLAGEDLGGADVVVRSK